MLFDRIVRQGRAFGIHVLLGSQTLGGAYTLARATLGQMVIRIALQCNEADAYLIMDENNPAPRLLSRPGEGIYNDAAGAMEGNSPFQVVWLPDDERDQLSRQKSANAPTKARQRIPARSSSKATPRRISAKTCRCGAALEAAPAATPDAQARIWLGAPNSIKGPTEAVFHRQSGNNLLIVGQREEAHADHAVRRARFAGGAISVGQRARFVVLDSTPARFAAARISANASSRPSRTK